MKRSVFLLITALASLAFGCMLFFLPEFASKLLGIADGPEVHSIMRGMGGLIVGMASINFFLRNHSDTDVLTALLVTNCVTHAFGLGADLWGIADGALTSLKMVPVEITHLFVGIGSLVYLLQLKSTSP